MKFEDLNLHPTILKAVTREGYTVPTPVQAQAIPLVLQGGDVLGCAQTGTGKTAAFALPILHNLSQNRLPLSERQGSKRPIRTLVLAPTRELALQIHESFVRYGRYTGLRSTYVFGGVGQTPQVNALSQGVDILVATPGRLLDLTSQGFIDTRHIQTFVLDEADRMLDMGFIHDIRKVVANLPRQRQTLLFSATLLPEIRALAGTMLNNPRTVTVAPPASTVDRIEQCVHFVEKSEKINLLIRLLEQHRIERALVFTRTKYGADKVVRKLSRTSFIAAAIHGNKSQGNRQAALAAFKSGKASVLVATDIASRGLDIDEVSHVFNLDLPMEPEAYVHRIGRTARAGHDGAAISFCSDEERKLLNDIERLIRKRIPVAQQPAAGSIPKSPGNDAARAAGHEASSVNASDRNRAIATEKSNRYQRKPAAVSESVMSTVKPGTRPATIREPSRDDKNRRSSGRSVSRPSDRRDRQGGRFGKSCRDCTPSRGDGGTCRK